jgi:chitin disaccharide deacetylase
VPRHLIVNADDLGTSPGVNRGIVDAHERGIVTSASLMVDRAAAADGAERAAALPRLSVGLHFEGDDVDLSDVDIARAELDRQLERFHELVGRGPTHIDSHHHVHRAEGALDTFRQVAASLDVPLRDASPVTFIGGFYAQWEWEVTELHYVSTEFLEQVLRTEVTSEWTELGCHPGYIDPDFESVYRMEREEELKTLTDPRLPAILADCGIELRSYADFG